MSIRIIDSFGAAADPKLPFLARALDPGEVERLVAPLLTRGGRGSTRAQLREIRVVRHKAGRRCVVGYRFDVGGASARPEVVRVFGKARARGADARTHALLEALWRSGFRPDRERATAVPEPLGVVPEFHMTVQRAVPGYVATELVGGPQGIALMGRVAEAIHALHGAGIRTNRCHGLADELRILDERLSAVSAARPKWEHRIKRLMRACEGLASRVIEPPPRGIHRDFYPDQVIVDGDRLTLLDFDLYALGDPALDVGNFAGHLTELALRRWGDSEALRDREEALWERTLELDGDVCIEALRAYTVLTLARHVHISTTLPDRRHTTSELLELCERRLKLGKSSRPSQKFSRSRSEAR